MKSGPLHLLVESRDHIITVEVSSGETYQGKLESSEDNMNMQLTDVVLTSKSGQTSHLNKSFIRGSHVVMIIYPELLKNAPVLRPDLREKVKTKNAKKRKNGVNNKKRNADLPPAKRVAKNDR